MPSRPPTHKPAKRLTPRYMPEGQSWGKGRGGRPWQRLRKQILLRDQYLCQCEECRTTGTTRLAHEVDHIIPISQGGTDDPSNLQAINRDCHRIKTQKESRQSR